MTAPVIVPLWLFVLIVLFAGVTFASHFLFPSVRWFFRRRAERLVARLNKRLAVPIQPFKLARRHDMIQRLSYDPEVAQAVIDHAAKNGVPENVAFETAQRYAREIVPSFSASAYFGFAIRAARWLSNLLFRVRVGSVDDAALQNIDTDSTIIFVMNHRSNMDYVLVTYLVGSRSALSYAVGEWARIWPLSFLIRSMGAYFIRRKSRTNLYRKVLARYVRLSTDGGVAQAMFPEGGLSLTGALAQPKVGLLKYMIEGRAEDARDLTFVPVALNYDRVLEDRVLMEAASSGERKFRARISVILGFTLRVLGRMLRGKFNRFGVAGVCFGAPLPLAELKGDTPEALAEELMRRIEAAMPVLPVPVVATCLLEDGPMSQEDLTRAYAARTSALDVPQGLPSDVDKDAAYGVGILLRRRLISKVNGLLTPIPEERGTLEFYARSVAHRVISQS
ncbi:1-acyl-sn-glycerol-3-phosphate acyltransferase [Pseudaestuariivita sp.]|uniref:1-acyl-sn-glycerol-3-phosphate acyltransferase n=1 Tax=Pseudaestuariivita sp. TaxID=2211669 RepID=UPI004059428E